MSLLLCLCFYYVESVEILELDLANQTPFVKTMKVSDGPSSLNPSGDHSSSRTTLVANLDVGILAPDSRIVLKARLGGKWSAGVGCVFCLVYLM